MGHSSTFFVMRIAFLAVALLSSAFSLEIHVDPVNGNDTTGRGSLSKPLRTVLAARNALRARASVEGARFPLSWQTARLALLSTSWPAARL